MTNFRVLETQFQKFIKPWFSLDYDDGIMTRKYFLAYTGTEKTEGKVNTSNALDASLVDTESSGTELGEHDTSSRSGNDAYVDDVDIIPIYDEEPMDKVPMFVDDNVSATRQQHTKQPELNNEGEVDQNAEQCHDIHPLPDKLTDNQTIELLNQSLESENPCLKKIVA
ncbi:hypothetical protein Tco_1420266 [Tanacetum coccineum]